MTTTKPPRRVAGDLLRGATRPLVKHWPVARCPGGLGTLHHLRVPGNVEPQADESPAGGADARIVFRLLESALALEGDVAECGVWKGQMLIPIALFVRHRAAGKQVLGFDSFQGLDGTVDVDRALGGDADERKRVGGFSDTSLQAIARRVLYESYRTCLEFFYPRLAPGGVILLDEYNDPPWPGCTRAVGEFVADKPETVERIVSDNYVKYYLRKR